MGHVKISHKNMTSEDDCINFILRNLRQSLPCKRLDPQPPWYMYAMVTVSCTPRHEADCRHIYNFHTN